jgi:hypothetical protein
MADGQGEGTAGRAGDDHEYRVAFEFADRCLV